MSLHTQKNVNFIANISASECLNRWEDEGGLPCHGIASAQLKKPGTHNGRRLNKLTSRHQTLDNKLNVLRASPSACNLHIQALKKQKLFVKDQMMKLQRA